MDKDFLSYRRNSTAGITLVAEEYHGGLQLGIGTLPSDIIASNPVDSN